jgi:hypothetical protein
VRLCARALELCSGDEMKTTDWLRRYSGEYTQAFASISSRSGIINSAAAASNHSAQFTGGVGRCNRNNIGSSVGYDECSGAADDVIDLRDTDDSAVLSGVSMSCAAGGCQCGTQIWE